MRTKESSIQVQIFTTKTMWKDEVEKEWTDTILSAVQGQTF